MSSYRVAVLPGDGVGPEIANEAVRVLDTAAARFGFDVETTTFAWGCDHYLSTGSMMPDDALETLSEYDAIFLGSIGDASKVADDVSLTMLLDIRKGFDQYVNLRPIRLYPGVDTPIRTATSESVDLVVVRENTEGEYSRLGGFFRVGEPDGFALQTGVFTQRGCERLIRYGFELAVTRADRPGHEGAGRVTNCSKSNALNYSMVFWDSVFNDVAQEYPAIETDSALVDAITMWLVKNPESFDVVVASNLFGDIITDLAAMLQGGMGMAAGGNIDPERRYPSMFEPIHGSAPKYTGMGRVNPIASIEATRMLLDHLGEPQAVDAVGAAIGAVLDAGDVRTADLGGTSSTSEVGAAIAAEIG